jgi:hypothetical protein
VCHVAGDKLAANWPVRFQPGVVSRSKIDLYTLYIDTRIVPGHFFNSEHSPYLFPMFNFKKHKSMNCELLCNQLYRTPEILK